MLKYFVDWKKNITFALQLKNKEHMKITYRQKLSVVSLRANGIDFSKDVYSLTNSEIELVRNMSKLYNYSTKDNGSSLCKTSRFYVFMQRIFNYMVKNKIII